MKVIADHKGAGGGSVEFGDDPRMYEFLVESSGVDWSISVTETLRRRNRPKGRASDAVVAMCRESAGKRLSD